MQNTDPNENPSGSDDSNTVTAPTSDQVNDPSDAPEQPTVGDDAPAEENADTNGDDSFQFSPDPDGDTSAADDHEFDHVPAVDPNDIVTWTGPEFVHHQKNGLWYGVYAVAAVIIIAVIYFITKDVPSTVILAAGAVLFVVYGARKPREVTYVLTPSGVKINQKEFHIENYRTFSVVPEAGSLSIVFMPIKRFATQLTVYYPKELEEKIVGLLGSIMPEGDYEHDAVDRLMHKIRF